MRLVRVLSVAMLLIASAFSYADCNPQCSPDPKYTKWTCNVGTKCGTQGPFSYTVSGNDFIVNGIPYQCTGGDIGWVWMADGATLKCQ